jgi:hypothetical protein
MKIAIQSALFALVLLACLLVWDLDSAANRLSNETSTALGSTSQATLGSYKSIVHFVTEDLKVVGGIATNLEKSTRDLHATLTAQADSLRTTSNAFGILIADTNESLSGKNGLLPHATDLLADTNVSLNGKDGLLPHATDAVANLEALTDKQGDLALTLASAAQAAKNLAEITGDPALLETARNLAATSAQMAKISLHMEAIAGDLQGYVHHAVQPMSRARLAYLMISQAFPLIAHALP